jgi:hypothetical protein
VVKIPFDGLHNMIEKVPPVVADAAQGIGDLQLQLLSATGTGILLAAIIAGLLMKLLAARSDSHLWAHDLARALLAAHHRADAGAGLPHTLLRHSTRRWAWPSR